MAINKKLITFDKKLTFLGANGINNLSSPVDGYYNLIPTWSMVFIKDTGEIWHDGVYFGKPIKDQIAPIMSGTTKGIVFTPNGTDYYYKDFNLWGNTFDGDTKNINGDLVVQGVTYKWTYGDLGIKKGNTNLISFSNSANDYDVFIPNGDLLVTGGDINVNNGKVILDSTGYIKGTHILNTNSYFNADNTLGKTWSSIKQFNTSGTTISLDTTRPAIINIQEHAHASGTLWVPWIAGGDITEQSSWGIGLGGDAFYIGRIAKSHTENSLSEYWKFDSEDGITISGTTKYIKVAGLTGASEKIFMADGTVKAISDLSIVTQINEATTTDYGGFKLTQAKASTQQALVSNTTGNGRYAVKMNANGTLYVEFAQANTWLPANNSLEGYVPQLSGSNDAISSSLNDYVLTFTSSDAETIYPTWRRLPSSAFENTWRGIYVDNTSKLGTGTTTKPINFKAGNGVILTFTAAGDNVYNTLQIDGTTYSTATDSVLGLVKVGTTLDNVTGFTAVHIKDGKIYYKDTTYSFSNLKFQLTSGTDLMTYDSQAARTILAGDNITFTHSNNVLTIKATDTTYSTASNSTLGLVKTGAAVTDTTGMTAVHIKDGVIYYKDTNTTYSTASNTNLGLVKTGAAINDTTGYTACHIKDGIIYYKDTNTTYSTATSSTLGLVKVGNTINDTTGYTAVHINDGKIYYKDTNTTYSTATSSVLGLVKIGDTLSDTTGYTKVAIKNGVIYYKDTNTTYSTATSSALGLVKVGDTINDTTGYTAVHINNGKIYYKDTNTTYNTATSSVLGLVKIGSTITDTTGYTKVAIKDGVIYYKDTNTTYSTATSSVLGLIKVGDTLTDTTGYTKVAIKDGIAYYKDTNTTYSTATSSTLGLVKVGDTISDATNYTACKIKDGVIYYKDTNTWKAANTSQEGYVPKLVTGGGTIASSDTAYVLAYKSGVSGTTAPVWVQLPDNAYNNTWNAFTAATATKAGTAGYIQAPAGALNKFFRGDNTWQDVLMLSGGTMTGNITFSGDNNINWTRNTDSASISFKNTGDGDTDSYMSFVTADNGNEYFRFSHTSGTNVEWATIKSDGIRVKGTLVSLEGHKHPYTDLTGSTTTANLAIVSTGTANGWTLKTLGSNAFNSTDYLPLSGGVISSNTSQNTLFVVNTTNSTGPCITQRYSGTVKSHWGYYPSGGYTYLSNEAKKAEIRITDDGELKFTTNYSSTASLQTVWHTGNLTKVSQLTNDSGYITRWPKWTEVTDKPSSFAPSAHDHERILPTRHDSNAPSPKDKGASLTLQFSYRVIGTDWWNVLNIRSYSDYNYLSAQILTPAGNPGSDIGYGDMYWRLGRQSTWITARKILDDLNSSVSKSGETLTVKIGGNSQSLTNTWRGITDSYSGTNLTISLSLKGANDLYNALNNGNADTVDYYHALTLTGSEGRNLIRSYDIAKTGSGYLVASYQPTEYLLKDEVYTCTFEILANGRTNPVPHLGNGRYCLFSSTITSGTRGIYSVTFTCNYTATNDSDARFDFYIRSAESGSTTIYRIKLERGPKFTGWSAAPEDLVLLYNAQTITGAKTFSTIITGDITGNAGTATKWLTARTLTIGNTGKSVDGSGNVSWSLSEIGAAAASHSHSYLPLSGGTMNAGTMISWQDWGQWGASNPTYPKANGGLSWSGTSDNLQLFAEEVASDDLRLILKCGDDASPSFDIRNSSGTTTIRLLSNGNITANGTITSTFSGNLTGNCSGSAGSVAWANVSSKPASATRWPTWDEVTGKPSTFPPSDHDHQRILPTRHDSDAPGPNTKGQSLTFQFSYFDGDWWNVLNMRSYSDLNYMSALLLSPAGNPGSDVGYGDLYWRLGRRSTWIAKRKILDSSNYTSYTYSISLSDARFVRSFHNVSTNPSIDTFTDTAYFLTLADSGSWAGGAQPSGSHNGLGIINMHTHTGSYYTLLALDTNLNRLWIRSANNSSSWSGWKALAYTSEIPTNTWRPITNTYTGSDQSTSVSQYGTNALYNALVNGYANEAGSATRCRYVTCPDTRDTMPTPGDYTASTTGVSFDFKYNGVSGLSGASYAGIMTVRPYAGGQDWSGGPAHQLAFNGDGRLLHRTGTSSWGSWVVVPLCDTSGNLTCTNFYTTSDRNKKTNISSFSEHIRKFQLKDTEKWHYGVIAQEVEEMFRDGEEGNMTVNYNSVLSFYIGQLENKVKMLEDKLKKYEEIQNI